MNRVKFPLDDDFLHSSILPVRVQAVNLERKRNCGCLVAVEDYQIRLVVLYVN